MAVLTNPRRAALHAELMALMSQVREGTNSMNKAAIRAAVDAADDWANTNASAYNSALPVPFRTTATAAQKARLLSLVIEYRYADGS